MATPSVQSVVWPCTCVGTVEQGSTVNTSITSLIDSSQSRWVHASKCDFLHAKDRSTNYTRCSSHVSMVRIATVYQKLFPASHTSIDKRSAQGLEVSTFFAIHMHRHQDDQSKMQRSQHVRWSLKYLVAKSIATDITCQLFYYKIFSYFTCKISKKPTTYVIYQLCQTPSHCDDSVPVRSSLSYPSYPSYPSCCLPVHAVGSVFHSVAGWPSAAVDDTQCTVWTPPLGRE